MFLRIAIYARYSSVLQSDRSIEDQVELCRSWLKREGHQEVALYHDRAKTSETLKGRDGLARLLDDATQRKFDGILVECVDRISRDAADLHHVARHLRFHEIKIISANEGVQNEIQIGVRGIVGAQHQHDLRDKVHRGLAGNINKQRSAGGKAYGYTPVPGKPGELQIEPFEADVIRRIYRDCAAGESPRAIAGALNAEGVSPPRDGAAWNASTLNGSADRGYGVLRNSIYAGVLIWDRVRMVRNPSTGKRVSRTNPAETWVRSEVPSLRIVDQQLWDAVQARLATQSHAKFAGRSTRKPTRPFSGLLKCGSCGGGMAIHDRKGPAIRICCSTSRESGSCANSGKYRLDMIENEVFAALHDHLMHPSYLEAYVTAYDEELRTLAAAPKADKGKLEKAAVQARRLFEKRLGLFERGILDGPEGEAKLLEAKHEMRAAEAALRALEIKEPKVTFNPATPARFARAIQELLGSMTSHEGTPDARARDEVRALVSEIVVSPADDDGVPIEVRGRLSALVSSPDHKLGGAVVAEEGLEPPTRGL